MHWMRPTVAPSIEPASDRARIVFAVPGTSSNRTFPPAASAARTSSIRSVLPRTTVSTLSRRRSAVAAARSKRSFGCIAVSKFCSVTISPASLDAAA